jgi:hypothetical protein
MLIVGGEEGELVEDVPDYWWRKVPSVKSSRLKARWREVKRKLFERALMAERKNREGG